MIKKLIPILLVLAICFSLGGISAAAAYVGDADETDPPVYPGETADAEEDVAAVQTEAADDGLFPEELYLQQDWRGTCTLCSATMMLRGWLYRHGSDAWQEVWESDVRQTAWCSEGLYWNWSYTVDGYEMRVAHASVSGISADTLEALLEEHPEGIALYCGRYPHAVFITDVTDGVVYCADPSGDGRTPIDESILNAYGGQSAILRNVTAYWYIT